jgi:hypothetical protein
VISCGNNQEKEEVKKPKPLMSLMASHDATENIKPIYLKQVQDLIKNLKDSVKPKKFKILSLDARINILYTEALRLADLTDIGAIKAAEINTQLDKTMTAFSNVTIKINTVLEKINFENEINIDVPFIGLDSSKIDTISKKSIDLKFKEELINRSNLYKESYIKQQL